MDHVGATLEKMKNLQGFAKIKNPPFILLENSVQWLWLGLPLNMPGSETVVHFPGEAQAHWRPREGDRKEGALGSVHAEHVGLAVGWGRVCAGSAAHWRCCMKSRPWYTWFPGAGCTACFAVP